MHNLRNRYFLAFDIILILISPLIALGLRVDFPWDRDYGLALAAFSGMALLIKLPVFYAFRLYSRYWLFASIDALFAISLAVFLTLPLVLAGTYFLSGLGVMETGLPRSIPVIDALLTLVFVGGTRFGLRAFQYSKNRYGVNKQAKRVLIVGAGDAGQIVAREIYASEHVSLNLIGFVDDNPQKMGSTIQGVMVLGRIDKLLELLDEYYIQEVIIAMPTAPGLVIRKVVQLCEQAGVSAKILPGVYELLTGQVNVNRLREVEIGDLLRRDSVQVDSTKVGHLLAGKRILVTGAGGSIGSELCKQIAACQPSQMVLIGHGENSLYALEEAMTKLGYANGANLQLVVADVRQKRRLAQVFSAYQPEIVFHAAAHKHVPLMEKNIEDAITNNVLGTWNIVQLARDNNVARFVLVSTDKAVSPVNIMGMTKRVAELIVHHVAVETKRPYVSVRFGNVLGSRGSVVPLFKRQITNGGPVTVTHPEMIRYFMTIPEAVQLVLQASALGTNGELFVLDMGEPIKIDDLARDMIELSGLKVGDDIQIEYTGLRPGERLYENLFSANEHPLRTEHEKIFVNRNGCQTTDSMFVQQIETLIQFALAGQTESAEELLHQLACGDVM